MTSKKNAQKTSSYHFEHHFFKSKHIKHHFCFSGILWRFSKISMDCSRIFTKSKLLGVRLHSLHPSSYTTDYTINNLMQVMYHLCLKNMIPSKHCYIKPFPFKLHKNAPLLIKYTSHNLPWLTLSHWSMGVWKDQSWFTCSHGCLDFKSFSKKGIFLVSCEKKQQVSPVLVHPWKNFGKFLGGPTLEKNPSDAHACSAGTNFVHDGPVNDVVSHWRRFEPDRSFRLFSKLFWRGPFCKVIYVSGGGLLRSLVILYIEHALARKIQYHKMISEVAAWKSRQLPIMCSNSLLGVARSTGALVRASSWHLQTVQLHKEHNKYLMTVWSDNFTAGFFVSFNMTVVDPDVEGIHNKVIYL